jgi:hypothetical protein
MDIDLPLTFPEKSLPKLNVFAAWVAGGFVYMYLALDVLAIVEAGVIDLPSQFILGAIVSFFFVGVAAFAGLILRVPVLSRLWYATLVPAAVLIISAVVLLLRGEGWDLTLTYEESDATYRTLHPAVAYGCLFAVVFATLHFPTPSWLRRVPPSII